MSSPVDEIISAATRGDLDLLMDLLARDPSLASAANMFGTTALHAAYYSAHYKIVGLLLYKGRTLDGFLAAELGLVGPLSQFLRQTPGLALERNAAGATPLHGACYWGSVDAARLLLEHGADVRAATSDPFLQIHPLGCAVATPDVPNPSQDESVVLQLVDLLLDRGAEVNARRRDGMTALHSAAYRGHLQVIRRLLDRGADPTIRAHDDAGAHAGQTAADTAASQGQTAAAELLRGAGG
jgi:uncharacterized protein